MNQRMRVLTTMDAIRFQLGLIERHAADEDSAIRVFPDFRQQEEGGIIIPGGGIPVRIGQLAAPRFPPMDRSNTPNTSNTPSTPITPNTSIPRPMAGLRTHLLSSDVSSVYGRSYFYFYFLLPSPFHHFPSLSTTSLDDSGTSQQRPVFLTPHNVNAPPVSTAIRPASISEKVVAVEERLLSWQLLNGSSYRRLW
jgi:hypothetical protein